MSREETSVKEYPILFSGPMVNAIRANRKHVTRRLSKQWLKVKAGDRLWVIQIRPISFGEGKCGIGDDGNVYDISGACPKRRAIRISPYRVNRLVCEQFYGPAPRASRILLECEEDARTELLQDITCQEVMDEGSPIPMRQYSSSMGLRCDSARCWYRDLWNTLHTKPGETWAGNPTIVRVGRFRLISP